MILTLKTELASVDIRTKGAQVVSFLDAENVQYLWQGDKAYWGGQSPILFPIVGGLRNGKTIIDGQEYAMVRHGFARASEFTAEQIDEKTAIFTIESNEETKKMYPFDFIFKVIYKLDGKTLTWEYEIENTGNKEMIFAVGGHPAINCPILPDEKFEDYVIEFPENETSKCPTVSMETGLIDFDTRYDMLENSKTIELKHDLFYQDALIFDDLKSRSCKLYSPKSGRGVEMNFGGFDMFGIWSAVNDAPFVCLEPWTGCATTFAEDDNFKNKRDMIFLPAGEVCKKSFSVTLI